MLLSVLRIIWVGEFTAGGRNGRHVDTLGGAPIVPYGGSGNERYQ